MDKKIVIINSNEMDDEKVQEVFKLFEGNEFIGDEEYFKKGTFDYLNILEYVVGGEIKAILVSEVKNGDVIATHSLSLSNSIYIYKLHKILYSTYKNIFFQVDLRNKRSLRGCETLVKYLGYEKTEGSKFMYYNKRREN
jgi:hypothetical protein